MASKRSSPKKLRAQKSAKNEARLSLDDLDQLEAQKENLLQAQSELEESRNQYAELFDRAPIGFVTLTGSGQIRKINFASALLLGRSCESLGGMNMNSMVHSRLELQKLLQHLRHCRDNETNVVTSLVLKSADGGPIPVELISYPIGDKTRVYHTAIIDLSARQKADTAIRASEGRFRHMANNAPVLIWIADTTKACIWFNKRWLDFVGRPMETEIGGGWAENVHSDDLQRCVKIYSESFDARRPFEMEYRLRRNDGEYRWILDQGIPLHDESGKFTGYIGSCIDITDRKRGEDELKHAKDETEKASRAKDDFLAALSHELRTPLNPVLLIASDAAKNHDLPPRVRTDFDTIRKNVELEARLIDDLLDMTRVARGKLALERRELDLHAVLRDAIATVQGEIEQKKIVLSLRLDAVRHSILGDAARLQQIFWNVLKNAIKFTPESGIIAVETQSVANEKLVTKITDTGIGMNSQELNRVFVAFSQGDHAEGGSHRFGGLGLGLAISRALVEKQSGRIRAESGGKGRGATFTIEFPLLKKIEIKSSGTLKRFARKVPAGKNPVPLRILLVEDHEPTRTSLTQLLLRRNYKVTSAASLAEARSLAQTEKFDLLVSDIGLPDGNGFDLMKEFHAHHGLRGVALTGYGMEEDVQRSYDAGFVTHLTKPVKMESLDEALAAATKTMR